MPGYTEFGKRLRAWREDKGLSQEGLGGKLGVERLTVTRWENGQTFPPPKTLQRVSEVTGKQVSWFFQDDEPAEIDVPSPGAPPEEVPASSVGGHNDSALADLIAQAVEAATKPLVEELRGIRSELHSKLDAQATRLNHQAAEVHRLRQEVREQHRSQNRLNDAKYHAPHNRSDQAPSADARAEGA